MLAERPLSGNVHERTEESTLIKGKSRSFDKIKLLNRNTFYPRFLLLALHDLTVVASRFQTVLFYSVPVRLHDCDPGLGVDVGRVGGGGEIGQYERGVVHGNLEKGILNFLMFPPDWVNTCQGRWKL